MKTAVAERRPAAPEEIGSLDVYALSGRHNPPEEALMPEVLKDRSLPVAERIGRALEDLELLGVVQGTVNGNGAGWGLSEWTRNKLRLDELTETNGGGKTTGSGQSVSLPVSYEEVDG